MKNVPPNPVKITAGPHYAKLPHVAELYDARVVRIEAPAAPWLDRIEISFEDGQVVVNFRLVDENANSPDLTVHSDGSFTTRS